MNYAGHSLGYGFVKYRDPMEANKALQTFNGLKIQNKVIKVSQARPSSETIKGANLYVSNLPAQVKSRDLIDLFGKYGNIISTRILSDTITGLSKGVAFIRYDLRSEAERAVSELNGKVEFGSPITVKFATQPAIDNSRILKPVLNDLKLQSHPYKPTKKFNSDAKQGHFSKSYTTHHPIIKGNKSKELSYLEKIGVNNNNTNSNATNNTNINNKSEFWQLVGPGNLVKISGSTVTPLPSIPTNMADLQQSTTNNQHLFNNIIATTTYPQQNQQQNKTFIQHLPIETQFFNQQNANDDNICSPLLQQQHPITQPHPSFNHFLPSTFPAALVTNVNQIEPISLCYEAPTFFNVKQQLNYQQKMPFAICKSGNSHIVRNDNCNNSLVVNSFAFLPDILTSGKIM